MGISGKFSRSSRAFSKMSNLHGVGSKLSAEYGIVVMIREQKNTGKVMAVREEEVTGGKREGRAESEEKILCLISHRTVLALSPRIKRGW